MDPAPSPILKQPLLLSALLMEEHLRQQVQCRQPTVLTPRTQDLFNNFTIIDSGSLPISQSGCSKVACLRPTKTF